MANLRQSNPDAGLGFQIEVDEIVQVVPSSLGNREGMGSGFRNYLVRNIF